ncbi:hypothetical protein DPMN_156267 [Dreissena polymorpha]|uniref:Uncharacterized protein n=1 Tax=Dreissena polymorpha TaxID=45954 RepID=A0A9D4FRZ7_DREPO|nr:hypothetical protein DPMN_156267 [Dreissena polymorpha]
MISWHCRSVGHQCLPMTGEGLSAKLHENHVTVASCQQCVSITDKTLSTILHDIVSMPLVVNRVFKGQTLL